MRYFKATKIVYQSICHQLDDAYGYPNASTKTERALPLAGDLPSDSSGLVYLAVSDEYCAFQLPADLLSQLLATGDVVEVSESAYAAITPEEPT